jgi:hypothetical protein
VPFHVEISRGFRHRAWAFNLDEGQLRRTILDPWIRGRVIMLGDQDWEPRDCKLVVLEGPELADTDLSMGRGWSNAEKTAENVTRKLVEQAASPRLAVAVLAESPDTEAEVARMLGRLELETVAWPELRARILGRPSEAGAAYAAVLVVDSPEPSPGWFFEAGLARGALQNRATFVQLGAAGIPAALAGVDVMRLDPGDAGSAQALRDRLAG